MMLVFEQSRYCPRRVSSLAVDASAPSVVIETAGWRVPRGLLWQNRYRPRLVGSPAVDTSAPSVGVVEAVGARLFLAFGLDSYGPRRVGSAAYDATLGPLEHDNPAWRRVVGLPGILQVIAPWGGAGDESEPEPPQEHHGTSLQPVRRLQFGRYRSRFIGAPALDDSGLVVLEPDTAVWQRPGPLRGKIDWRRARFVPAPHGSIITPGDLTVCVTRTSAFDEGLFGLSAESFRAIVDIIKREGGTAVIIVND
jgi:hypothetical protein